MPTINVRNVNCSAIVTHHMQLPCCRDRPANPHGFPASLKDLLVVSRSHVDSALSGVRTKGRGWVPDYLSAEHSCLETNARNVNCFAIVHAPCMQLPRCRACTWVIFDLRPVKFYGCASTRRTRVSYATA